MNKNYTNLYAEKMFVLKEKPEILLVNRFGLEKGREIFKELSRGIDDYYSEKELDLKSVLKKKLTGSVMDDFKFLSECVFDLFRFFKVHETKNGKEDSDLEFITNLNTLLEAVRSIDQVPDEAKIKQANSDMLKFIEQKFEESVDLQINTEGIKKYMEIRNSSSDDTILNTLVGNNPKFAKIFATAEYLNAFDTYNNEIINESPYNVGVGIAAGLDLDASVKKCSDARTAYNAVREITRKGILLIGASICAASLMPFLPGFLFAGSVLKVITTTVVTKLIHSGLDGMLGHYIDNVAETVAVNTVKLKQKVSGVIKTVEEKVLPAVAEKVGECYTFIAEKVVAPVLGYITAAVGDKVISACNWIKEKAVQAKNKFCSFVSSFRNAFS